jgi:hypothetical protein
VRLHARALGPWFSGAASTGALRGAGLLDGDALNAGMLDTLTAAHGPARMLDTF